jgi:hypothetical protein
MRPRNKTGGTPGNAESLHAQRPDCHNDCQPVMKLRTSQLCKSRKQQAAKRRAPPAFLHQPIPAHSRAEVKVRDPQEKSSFPE